MKTVITITGPTASGKSFLERMLVEHGCARIISHTTRPRRPGEENGRDYYFVSREIFLQAEQDGEFVEVVEFGDNFYGGSVWEFDKAFGENKPVVVVVEPNGRDQIREFCKKEGWECVSVYVENAPEVLAARMMQRFARELGDAIEKNDKEPIKDALRGFQKRLTAALGTEVDWRLEAWNTDPDECPYDILFREFDQSNDEEVVKAILTYVSIPKKELKEAA